MTRADIAAKMGTHENWARSFQHVKPLLTRMVADGEVFRFAPFGGRGFNMVALTQKGCDLYLGGAKALEVTWAQPRGWHVAQRRRSAAREERYARIAELMSEGWSASAIGREIGMTQQGVSAAWRRICAEMGA